ncbi:cell cycle checkpoint protein RAD17-like isoform X2 [Corticium candelabrum]|uniref:cell cycle checkpoint protein RAD17-like isoform X2 n=1 Tax=Corticium candelabrum TaxID=121492 RepID=UPI002E26B2D7|nr:cell cycle checkpoint protein RAD17-like isoform X2 [Corticium candelabrum]
MRKTSARIIVRTDMKERRVSDRPESVRTRVREKRKAARSNAEDSRPLGENRIRSWLVSSFDPASAHCPGRRREIEKEGPVQEGSLPWVDRYVPRSQSDLAVHKKKVTEVMSWIEIHLQPHCQKQGGSILIITGPPGAGKTATIKVLARDLCCQLQEWSNPIGHDVHQQTASEDIPWHNETLHYGESQTKQFRDFIFRSDKYGTLQLVGSVLDQQPSHKKIILVEDMPNAFYRRPDTLWPILKRFQQIGHCLLVFIVSDSTSGDSRIVKLFPSRIQNDLRIDIINFNPIATTNMTKAINKIVVMEMKRSGAILQNSKSVIADCAESSAGDIRSAINTIQMLCVGSVLTDRKAQHGDSIRRTIIRNDHSSSRVAMLGSDESNESKLSAIGGRDRSLFLFRALGKILYCKRLTGEPQPAYEQLRDHLADMERLPLCYVPEEIVEDSHLSPDYFTLYLHQNYLDFYQDVDDIVRAARYLSDADTLQSSFECRDTLHWCAVSIACRGLMHARCQSPSKSSWRPLHKPKCIEVDKLAKDNVRSAHHLFVELNPCQAHLWLPVELHTEILPFLAKLDVPLQSSDQIRFLQHLSSFARHSRSYTETLDERDVGTLEEEECSSQNQNSQLTSSGTSTRVAGDVTNETNGAMQEDEDEVIDEFEDNTDW